MYRKEQKQTKAKKQTKIKRKRIMVSVGVRRLATYSTIWGTTLSGFANMTLSLNLEASQRVPFENCRATRTITVQLMVIHELLDIVYLCAKLAIAESCNNEPI